MNYDPTRLTVAYNKFHGFTNYRDQELAKLTAAGSEIGTLNKKIQDARAAKRKAIAEYDLEIAVAKSRLGELTGATGLTELKAQFADRMRQEKAEMRRKWEQEVVTASGAGMSVREIVNTVPLLNNTVTVYNILNNRSVTMATEDVAVEETLPAGTLWQYSDALPVHRYALSLDGNYVRFHGVDVDDTPLVLTWPDMKYVTGDSELRTTFKEQRGQMLTEILNGEYDVSTLHRGANKYDTEG